MSMRIVRVYCWTPLLILAFFADGCSKKKLATAPITMPQTAGPIREFNSEEYDRIDETGFLETTLNPLSTFSVDVDTASYSNVRRFLREGRLPPPETVRIEEMINYFPSAYPESISENPVSVASELAAVRNLPMGSGGEGDLILGSARGALMLSMTRLAGLTDRFLQLFATIESSPAQAILHENLSEILRKASIRICELRRASYAEPPVKDEFETTDNYLRRRQEWLERQAVLMTRAGAEIQKIATETHVLNGLRVILDRYDADSERYSVRIRLSEVGQACEFQLQHRIRESRKCGVSITTSKQTDGRDCKMDLLLKNLGVPIAEAPSWREKADSLRADLMVTFGEAVFGPGYPVRSGECGIIVEIQTVRLYFENSILIGLKCP